MAGGADGAPMISQMGELEIVQIAVELLGGGRAQGCALAAVALTFGGLGLVWHIGIESLMVALGVLLVFVVGFSVILLLLRCFFVAFVVATQIGLGQLEFELVFVASEV